MRARKRKSKFLSTSTTLLLPYTSLPFPLRFSRAHSTMTQPLLPAFHPQIHNLPTPNSTPRYSHCVINPTRAGTPPSLTFLTSSPLQTPKTNKTRKTRYESTDVGEGEEGSEEEEDVSEEEPEEEEEQGPPASKKRKTAPAQKAEAAGGEDEVEGEEEGEEEEEESANGKAGENGLDEEEGDEDAEAEAEGDDDEEADETAKSSGPAAKVKGDVPAEEAAGTAEAKA
ncbi:hypothetical protein BDW62DRAFT_98651 [Aspergillus aurantiobrunneus]